MKLFKDFVVYTSNVSFFAIFYCALARYDTVGTISMAIFLLSFFLKVLFVALDPDE